MHKPSHKTIVFLLIALLGTICIAIGAWWVSQKPQPVPTPVVNTNTQPIEPVASGIVIPPTKTDCTDELDTECWNTYVNEEYGFSFKFPLDWEVDKPGVYKGPADDLVIATGTLTRNKFDLIKEGASINIEVVHNNDNNINPQSLELPGMGTIGSLVKENILILNSFFAKEFVFEGYNNLAWPQNTTPLIVAYITFVNKNIEGTITFGTGGDNRQQYLALFEHIVKTLKEIE